MSLKPIILHGNAEPNPPKVIMILKELGLKWEVAATGYGDVKKPEYLAINPNGRLPAIQDPNTNLTLWESGAIIEYLIETYDKENKISYPKGSNEDFLCRQWLFFQVSGQGPYYGNAVFFSKYHEEKLPSAIQRFVKEANRVTSVLESHLSKKAAGGDGPWLVGDKVTYADIAWVMWQVTLPVAAGAADIIDYSAAPTVKAWIEKLQQRPAVKGAIEIATQAYLAAQAKQ